MYKNTRNCSSVFMNAMCGRCINMQFGGGASGCKMAKTRSINAHYGVLFGGVKWNSSPVTFHWKKGENVKLTEWSTVATRNESYGYDIVFTSEPMIAGEMLKVTMTKKDKYWHGYDGMVRAHLVCAMLDCSSQ